MTAAGGTGALVDIREVSVNKELSREERITEFVRQIKDPYRFKCGRFHCTGQLCSRRRHLEECIKGFCGRPDFFPGKGLTFPQWRGRIRIGKELNTAQPHFLNCGEFSAQRKECFFMQVYKAIKYIRPFLYR